MPQRRFELIGKKRSTITAIDILSLKMGQTDVKPAICISFKTSMPNKEVLPMFSPKLLGLMYENTGNNTAALDGVQPVSDQPNLTLEAEALGALNYEYLQTGCKLIVYEGNSKLSLTGGEVRKTKIDCQEGGTVDVYWQFYTGEKVDDEVIGHMGVLKSLERDVELTAPAVVSQQKRIEEAEEQDTPEKAAVRAHAAKGAAAKAPATEAANGPKKRRA
jgi:hypothetical protein